MTKKTEFEDVVIDTLTKFNQTKYINDYKRSHYKNYAFRVRKDNTRLIEHLENQPNKNAYIIKLIEDDISRQ